MFVSAKVKFFIFPCSTACNYLTVLIPVNKLKIASERSIFSYAIKIIPVLIKKLYNSKKI